MTSNGPGVDPSFKPPPGGPFPGGGTGGVTTNVYTPGSDTLTSNGTFATTQSIPAGTGVAGTIYEIYADGIETVNGGANHQFTLKLGTSLLSTPIGFSALTGTGIVWSLYGRIRIVRTGATGTVYAEFHNTSNNSNSAGNVGRAALVPFMWLLSGGGSPFWSFTALPVAVDFTVAEAISIAVTGMVGGDSVQLKNLIIKQL